MVCRVTEGGPVCDNKGLSLPGMNVSVPAMSEKDIADLKFALVPAGRRHRAVVRAQRRPTSTWCTRSWTRTGARLPVIAKLEKPEAVDNLEAIVLAFDGIMVARGDLGVELPLEQVPLVQKRAIQIARENAKPVIVATQMLESMIEHSRPTRAEASDVANAVLDGADAVMLSGETCVGKYPIKTVRTMAQIIEAVEEEPGRRAAAAHVPRTKRGVLSYAARDIGERLSAPRARRVHPVRRHRAPARPAAHPRSRCWRSPRCPRCAASWRCPGASRRSSSTSSHSTDAMVRQVDHAMLSIDRFQRGDLVVIVAGSPPGTAGSTNLIRVHRLGTTD